MGGFSARAASRHCLPQSTLHWHRLEAEGLPWLHCHLSSQLRLKMNPTMPKPSSSSGRVYHNFAKELRCPTARGTETRDFHNGSACTGVAHHTPNTAECIQVPAFMAQDLEVWATGTGFVRSKHTGRICNLYP